MCGMNTLIEAKNLKITVIKELDAEPIEHSIEAVSIGFFDE